MANILIVEDERSLNQLICRNLELVGHKCGQVFDGNSALEEIEQKTWDIIILDVLLPEMTGFELIKEIPDVPVIFVTALDSIKDKMKGLTSGAEDYLVKPFEMRELIARVEIILRRFHKNEMIFELNGVKVAFDRRTVEKDGVELEITPKEFDLLEVFIKNRNFALSRDKLLDLAWGYDFDGDSRTVDVHVQKLRKKLNWEEHIKTVYKMGYRLEVK